MSDIEDLHKLAELKEKGILSQQEFDKKKFEILNRNVSTNAKNHAPKEPMFKGLWWRLPTVITVFAIVGSFLNKHYETSDSPVSAVAASNSSVSPATTVRVNPYERMRAMMPAEQSAMIEIVEAARQRYATSTNDMAKGASRPSRAQALCSALPNRTVNGWIGRVSKLNTNNQGKGVLEVEIGRDILIKTWNNSFSDISNKTLIEPSSALFSVAIQLKKGQLVRLNGQFFASETDCISESSVSLSGSINEPEFIFRFQSITQIEG